MPRFMMLMHPATFPEEGEAPPADVVAKMMVFNDELARAGVLRALDGLMQPSEVARVRFDGGRPSITDGPFTETKELIGGYWIIETSTREEAVRWASRCPAADGDMIEVRRIQDVPDETPAPAA
jgi:hypothetical protein